MRWEIIADPRDFGIEVLEEGVGNNLVEFPREERNKWAEEIGTFTGKLLGMAERAKNLQDIMAGSDEIVARPSSLKTLKVIMFQINDSVNSALKLANQLEREFIEK